MLDFPLTKRLPQELTAVDVFQHLISLPHLVFFDSAQQGGQSGRYSFVAADPFQWIEHPASRHNLLAEAEHILQTYRTETHPDLPPFQGGLAGLLGYDLVQSLEGMPATAIDDLPMDDLPIPALAMGCYDVVFAFDHQQDSGWILSQGFPEVDPQARRDRATARLAQAQQWLTNAPQPLACGFAAKTQAELAEQFDVNIHGITSNLSAEGYRQVIEQAIENIHAGDVFQVNLAQRLLCPAHTNSLDLYLELRQKNPAPYAGYLDLGSAQVCSASPECFLTVHGRHGSRQVETRPIKGTRGRSVSPEADLFVGDELQASEKDRAENIMIVDLMRNDLSRVCKAESVHVAQLCRLETFAFVKHLVSVVRGELREGTSPIDLLRACFPGGSITGAPKIRAMEIIAELEPTARGAYCGSLGYLGFDGQMDTSILIRTITAAHGWWQLPVGGGIVAQSDPEDEYHETWDKARGMLEAVQSN